MDAYDLSMDSDSFVVKPADNSNGKAVLLVNSIEGIAQHAQHIFDQVMTTPAAQTLVHPS